MDNNQEDVMLQSQSLSDEQKHWLISLSGYLSMQNGYSLDCLLHKSDTFALEAIVRGNQKVLTNSYGINNKAEFVETLNTLTDTMRSEHFREFLVKSVRADLYAERFMPNSQYIKDNEEKTISQWAETHAISLAGCGVKSFDFGRFAFLCRCAYTVGLITEDETWHYLHVLGKIAQQFFSNWQEFAMSHIVGRLNWVGVELSKEDDPLARYPDTFEVRQEIKLDIEELTSILADDEHPWCQLDWQITL